MKIYVDPRYDLGMISSPFSESCRWRLGRKTVVMDANSVVAPRTDVLNRFRWKEICTEVFEALDYLESRTEIN
jgi:hypothetical protein